MIQEYFDTFNTLHHKTILRGGSGGAAGDPAVGQTLVSSSKQQAILVAAAAAAAAHDDLFAASNHVDVPLFYSTQKHQQPQLVSAFKPFSRVASTNTANNESAAAPMLDSSQQHQYDRMNHHSNSKIAGKV